MLFALFYLFLFFFNQTKTVSFILCAQVDRECAEEKRGEWRQQLLETTKLIGNEHFVQHHLERWFLTLCWTSSLTFRHYVVSFPTRWSFSFILGPLHWSSSWQWQPSIAGCRLFQTLLWTQLANFAQFFCKMYLLYMWPSRKTCLVWFGWVLPP